MGSQFSDLKQRTGKENIELFALSELAAGEDDSC